MAQRPGFPIKLSTQEKAAPAKAPAKKAAPTNPQGLGLDSSAVRQRMVQKLAAQGLKDPLVLEAMGAVERHRFVESGLVNQAYEDTSLPIGLGQTISKPNVVARMVELLLEGTSGKLGRVLEIGTGCGYQAAVLSHVATEVYSIERLKGCTKKHVPICAIFGWPMFTCCLATACWGMPKVHLMRPSFLPQGARLCRKLG